MNNKNGEKILLNTSDWLSSTTLYDYFKYKIWIFHAKDTNGGNPTLHTFHLILPTFNVHFEFNATFHLSTCLQWSIHFFLSLELKERNVNLQTRLINLLTLIYLLMNTKKREFTWCTYFLQSGDKMLKLFLFDLLVLPISFNSKWFQLWSCRK